MRRGFSLLELLLAVGLSLFLIVLVASLFGRFVDVQERISDRVDDRRRVDALGARVAADAGRAVVIADLARSFDHAPTLVTTAAGAQVRADQLELVVLRDGALERVRWSVAWDPDTDRGYLWRESFPVTARELPVDLARLAGGSASRELVASSVDRFQLEVPGREALATGLRDLTVAGAGARLLHDELTERTGVLRGLRAGDAVWLEDDRIAKQAFPAGHYRVQTVEGDIVTFRTRIGSCSRVSFRAAKLPPKLALNITVSGARQALELPLGLDPAAREGLFVEPREAGRR